MKVGVQPLRYKYYVYISGFCSNQDLALVNSAILMTAVEPILGLGKGKPPAPKVLTPSSWKEGEELICENLIERMDMCRGMEVITDAKPG